MNPIEKSFHRNNTISTLFCVLAAILISAGYQVEAGNQKAGVLEIRKQIEYLLYLPDNYEAEEKWPLIVFLHGAGERGDDIEKVKVHGPPKLVESGKKFPFIILSPQCPTGRRWSTDTLLDLLDDISSRYKVDAERVYLTGLSMGGYGTWDLASRDAYRFAAIAPICGGGNPSRARRMAHLPIWVFHGGKDGVVPISQSESMVDAIKAAGGTKIDFTIYPDARHDSWTEAYNNPKLYDWFLQHKKQERRRRGTR
ncbi:MAG TPA: phospholipase [Verrucomicrobiales bacterium]|nr:phospholipase [Verrucomicrobiales bacterium]